MTAKIRVGAVAYLNTKPLIENLSAFSPNIDLRLELPSHLADQLHRGDLDVALIPIVEYFRGENYSIVPNIAIGSRGPVLSVTLFSRVPMDQITSVALDEGSRTSAALTQILLRKKHNLRPRLHQLPIDANPESVTTDAVLLIGDRAMKACLPGFPYAFDLGEEWTDWTGLPMVFAVWAVREGVDLQEVDEALLQAKGHGMMRTGIIAQREAPSLGLDAGFCRRYLSNVIRFDLGPQEEAGLRKYYEFAAEIGLAPEGVNIEYYHPRHPVESR